MPYPSEIEPRYQDRRDPTFYSNVSAEHRPAAVAALQADGLAEEIDFWFGPATDVYGEARPELVALHLSRRAPRSRVSRILSPVFDTRRSPVPA